MDSEAMHPNYAARLRGAPPDMPAEPVWWRLEEILATTPEHAEYLRTAWGPLVEDGGGVGYEIVRGWDNMATIAAMTPRQLRRGAGAGHLAVVYDPTGRDCKKVWAALSCLLRYARWRHGLRVY